MSAAERQPPLDFAAVVREHWDSVFRLVQTMSGDVHEAEDLTQEAFTRALSRLESFEPGTNMRAWLLRIATNAFFDERRKRKRLQRTEVPEEIAEDRAAPDQRLQTLELAELAKRAMSELTELTRLVFHLRVQEELSFREIAELAGTTEQSARWHMHQARTKLLGRLNEDAERSP